MQGWRRDRSRKLSVALSSQTEKAKRFWRLRCEQMLAHDELIEAKENEIVSLHAQLAASRTPKARSTDSLLCLPQGSLPQAQYSPVGRVKLPQWICLLAKVVMFYGKTGCQLWNVPQPGTIGLRVRSYYI